MIIGGFQKLSLLDYPEKISSVVFTQGCIFRCSFCHNPELVPAGKPGITLDENEIFEYIESKKEFIDGICVTGGEPTIHGDLPEFIARLKSFGLLIKLDTAGTNPRMVRELIEGNLVDYIAMDVKNSWDRYDLVVKVNKPALVENCKKTFKLIQESGIDHEFRTTVFPGVHTDEDFFAIARQMKEGEKYYIQNIRYKKTLDGTLDASKRYDMKRLIAGLKKTHPNVLLQERGGD